MKYNPPILLSSISCINVKLYDYFQCKYSHNYIYDIMTS
jgi:hypothetical protein